MVQGGRRRLGCLALLGGALATGGCFMEDEPDPGVTVDDASDASDASDDGGSTAAGGTDDDDVGTAADSGVTSSDDQADEGSSDDDGGSTGEAPTQCWDEDPAAWTAVEFDTTPFADDADDVVGLALDRTGLRLAYAVESGATRTGFIATRATRQDPFPAGEAIGQWAVDVPDLGGFRFTGVDELLSLLNEDSQIATSAFADGLWWPPELVTYDEAPVGLVGTPAFFGDGLSMMVDVLDTDVTEGEPVYRPYETSREDMRSPFGEFKEVIMPGWSEDTPILCVIPSPDGEHIVFGGAFPAVWSDSDQALQSALDIWYARRQDDGSWGDLAEIEVASHDERLACPLSVTEDGCMMTVRYFDLDGTGGSEYALVTR